MNIFKKRLNIVKKLKRLRMVIFFRKFRISKNRKKNMHQKIKKTINLKLYNKKPYEQQFCFNNKKNFIFGRPKRRWTKLVKSNFKNIHFSKNKNQFNTNIERELMKEKFQLYYEEKRKSHSNYKTKFL